MRRIERVEYAPSEFIEIPAYNLRAETEQGLWTAFADMTGSDYAYDMLGLSRAPKKNAIERLSFLLVGPTDEIVSERDNIEASLGNAGRLTLWDSDGRTASARLVSMPQISLGVTNRQSIPVVLIFERYSDWQEES